MCFLKKEVDYHINQWSNLSEQQEAKLISIIQKSKNSSFGKFYNFSNMSSISDFQKAVPIHTYEDLEKYIQEAVHGNTQALFNPGTKIQYFALSTGTTGPNKIIPITKQCLMYLKRSWWSWGVLTLKEHTEVISSRFLAFFSAHKENISNTNIPCGDIGGVLAKIQPAIISKFYRIPPSVSQIPNQELKYYLYLRYAIATEDVKFLITSIPATLISIAKCADKYKLNLLDDIRNGGLSYPGNKDEINQILKQYKVKKRMPKDPKRAEFMEQIINSKNKLYPKYFWPKLSLIATWTGGNFIHYTSTLKKYYGDCAIRDLGFIASEGHFSVPVKDNTSEGLLNLDYAFYEFIPESEYNNSNPTILTSEQIAQGEKYYIVITTFNGLFRYDIKDLIECTGHLNDIPLIKFISKSSHISDLTGEKISSYDVVNVMEILQKKFNFHTELFTLIPNFSDPPYYTLFVEESVPEKMESEFDEHLGEQNFIYKEHRACNKLGPIRIKYVKHDFWVLIKNHINKSKSTSLEQYKHPYLINDISFLNTL